MKDDLEKILCFTEGSVLKLLSWVAFLTLVTCFRLLTDTVVRELGLRRKRRVWAATARWRLIRKKGGFLN